MNAESTTDCPLASLNKRYPERVRAVLNFLVESPYFYRTDNEELFFFLRRHRSDFAAFYETFYDWELIMDGKCARVYKRRWYNDEITEAKRDLFDFRRRDECIAFMVLLEFFEHQLEENAMTVEDREDLRFRLGDLLEYTVRRFHDLFPEQADQKYTEEHVRGTILRQVLPQLERYRLVRRIRPPEDIQVEQTAVIFEARPAIYHYNAARLSSSLGEMEADEELDEEEVDGESEPDSEETTEEVPSE